MRHDAQHAMHALRLWRANRDESHHRRAVPGRIAGAAAVLTLTPDELRELTGKRRSDAQRRELEYMRVPFKVRRDGSLAVLRIYVDPERVTMRPEPQVQP